MDGVGVVEQLVSPAGGPTQITCLSYTVVYKITFLNLSFLGELCDADGVFIYFFKYVYLVI